MNQNETRSLKCYLSESERKEKADQAASMTEDASVARAAVDRLQGEVKTAKAHVESIEAQIRARLDTYKKGWESRQVECTWVPDKAAQVMRLIRSDTGEEIETREMPRQQTIDGSTSSVPKDNSLSMRDVIDVLTLEPMKIKDILEALPEATEREDVKRALAGLVNTGDVAKDGKGQGATYCLIPKAKA